MGEPPSPLGFDSQHIRHTLVLVRVVVLVHLKMFVFILVHGQGLCAPCDYGKRDGAMLSTLYQRSLQNGKESSYQPVDMYATVKRYHYSVAFGNGE